MQAPILYFPPLSKKKGLDYKQMGMSHYGLAIYIKKYLNAKEQLWKLKYFTMQKLLFSKNPL
jgi:hypothetical protein